MVFPGNKMKAVTFSYDDGVEQDIRLTALLNRYHLKGTFNLNSGIQTGASHWENNGAHIRRINQAKLREVYAGHEVAVHTLTHPHLEELDIPTIENEILRDRENLERIFGAKVCGMAYPFGTYDERVLQVVRESGIRYARAVQTTGGFQLPQQPLELRGTCHHDDPRLMELAEAFVRAEPSEPMLFYLWGHSYEFDVHNNWDVIERFCALIGGRDDIFYGTNAEVLGTAPCPAGTGV